MKKTKLGQGLLKGLKMALYENGKYHDPLHVPTGNLVVFYEGKPVLMLNKALLDQQNCWTNLEAIKEVHWFKHMLFDLIENTTDPVELKELAKDLTECEFELQRLWGFPEDRKFHKFWEANCCICPKLDNNDAYPSGYYAINHACQLHGLDKK